MKQIALLLIAFFIYSCQSTNESTIDTIQDKINKKEEPYDQEYLKLFGPEPSSKDFIAYKESVKDTRDAMLNRSDFFDGEWTIQGPGNIGGRVNIVASHPTNSDIIYAGFARGGLWKTTNNGGDWIPLWDEQTTQAISAIALDPNNSEIIYAGSGDVNVSGNVFLGNGLFKSEDGGITWEYIGLEEAFIIGDILINPENSQQITVATMGNPFVKDQNRGVYYTDDGGNSWTQTLYIADDTGVHDLAYNKANPAVMLAGGWTRHRTGKVSSISGPNSKVYRSTDNGQTWNLLNLDTPEVTGRTSVTFSKKDPLTAYAMFISEGSYFQSLHKTLDGGETWEIIHDDSMDPPTMMGGFAWFFGRIEALTVPGTEEEMLYLCGVDLYGLDENTNEWNMMTPPWWEYSVHADKHSIITDADGSILLGTDGGLYRQTETGEWDDIENIPNNMFYRVAYNPHVPEFSYGGMQDNGSSGGNANIINDWPRLFGGDGFQMAFDPNDNQVQYAETQNGRIYVSYDAGYDFFGIDLDSLQSDRKNWDMQYIISPHNSDIIYTGTYRAVKLDQLAPSAISGELTDEPEFINSYHTITALDESKITEGLLYYGTADGNVWIAENENFVNINSNLPKHYVTSIKASATYENVAYITLSNYKFDDHSPRIYRTDDQGATWNPIAEGLPTGAANDIVILDNYGDSILFAATNVGVYASINAGEIWHRLGESLPLIPVNDLVINESKNLLIAGTYGRSINTYPIDSLIVEYNNQLVKTTTEELTGIQLYPNPASNFIMIDSKEPLELTLIDNQGKVIRQQKVNGSQKISIDNIIPGNYNIYLRNKEGLTTTKSFVKI